MNVQYRKYIEGDMYLIPKKILITSEHIIQIITKPFNQFNLSSKVNCLFSVNIRKGIFIFLQYIRLSRENLSLTNIT